MKMFRRRRRLLETRSVTPYVSSNAPMQNTGAPQLFGARPSLPRVLVSDYRVDPGVWGGQPQASYGFSNRTVRKVPVLMGRPFSPPGSPVLLHPRHPPAKLQVQVPRRVRMCVQRKRRRESLFALGVAGKGLRRSPGPYFRNEDSQWGC